MIAGTCLRCSCGLNKTLHGTWPVNISQLSVKSQRYFCLQKSHRKTLKHNTPRYCMASICDHASQNLQLILYWYICQMQLGWHPVAVLNGLWSLRMLHIPHFWPNNQLHLITSLLTSSLKEDKGTEAKPSVWNVKWLLFSHKILQNNELSFWFVLWNRPQMSKYSHLWQHNFCNRKKRVKHGGTNLVSPLWSWQSAATSFGKISQSGNTLELSYGISQALNPELVWV
jgi:hypothetical protein